MKLVCYVLIKNGGILKDVDMDSSFSPLLGHLSNNIISRDPSNETWCPRQHAKSVSCIE